MRCAQAVGDGAHLVDPFRLPAREAAVHGIGAFRLDAEDQRARRDLLHRRGHPGAKPPAPDGNHDRVEILRLRAQLEPEGGGAERGERPFERMDESAPLLLLDLLHPVEGAVDVIDQLHLRAVVARALHTRRIRVLRHHHFRGGPQRSRGVPDRHRVIAGAHRGDAARELLPRQRPQVTERAAGLEASRVLEELELEQHLRAGAYRGIEGVRSPSPHGRLHHEPFEVLPRVADLRQGRSLHRATMLRRD